MGDRLIVKGVFNNRRFTLLLSGQAVSKFGNSVFTLALPWYVYTVTHSKIDLTIAALLQATPGVVGLFTGVLVEHWSKKKVMVLCDVLRALLAGMLFFVVLRHYSLGLVYLLVFVLQIIGTFFWPASKSVIPLIVDRNEISAAYGVSQSSSAASQFSGTLFGGVLFSALGASLLFLLDAVTFVVSVVTLLFISVTEEGNRRISFGGRGLLKEWVFGLNTIKASQFLTWVMISTLVVNLGTSGIDIAITVWVKDSLNGTSVNLALITMALFLGIILGGLFLNRISKLLGTKYLFSIGLLLLGLLVFAFPLIDNVWYNCLINVFMGFVIGVINGALDITLVRYVPAEVRARAFGVIGALAVVSAPIGISMTGILLAHLSYVFTFMIIALLCVMSSIPFFLRIDEKVSKEDGAVCSTN
jgi:DHA3 family macrolide efflux protein-like MFS transporter